MKVLILTLISLMSLAAFSDSNKERKDDTKERRGHPAPLSIFDVIPLNSPVKGSVAKFLLEIPKGFAIDEVTYKVRNAGRIFEKVSDYRRIDIVGTENGKELQLNVSKLPPGFYQLFVKVRDRKNNEYEYKNKFKDHAMFVVDEKFQVPIPDPKKNEATIGGVDSDGDGIRDDIQRWINETYSTQPKVKMAVRQVSMGMQVQLLTISNRAESIIATQKKLDDMVCLTYIIGLNENMRITKILEDITLNTKDRLYANIKSNGNFNGESHSLPARGEEQKLCSFNPDNF